MYKRPYSGCVREYSGEGFECSVNIFKKPENAARFSFRSKLPRTIRMYSILSNYIISQVMILVSFPDHNINGDVYME